MNTTQNTAIQTQGLPELPRLTIDPSARLTEHFTLGEMTRSGTAIRENIDNTPPPEAIRRLTLLCRRTLEPLRRRAGRLIVTSGYRCPRLNRCVGGVANSQHLTGEAADIYCPSEQYAYRLTDILAKGDIPFDQAIVEHSRCGSHYWLHLSYVADRKGMTNRAMTIDHHRHTTTPDSEELHRRRLKWAWDVQQEEETTDRNAARCRN
ncbi:MAG: hypothetical protein K5928_06300 [Prevotella sp.]|nr:hypothetical protein [Prevotella sp.]